MITPEGSDPVRVHLVSLGCVRNLVDSELILGALAREGFVITDDPADAQAIIVNTCGFIRSAVDESIDVILELAEYKDEGECRTLVVCGCMAQRYGNELKNALPEADAVIGPGAHNIIPSMLKDPGGAVLCQTPDPSAAPLQKAADPRICSTPHMAYVKVSEGCPDRCTFCMIPSLRGAWRSRPPRDIVKEVKNLAAWGAREIILTAQDTTAYGQDFTGHKKTSLARLLKKLCELDALVRYRFLYGHPNRISDELLDVIAGNPRICPYLDVPVQHASDSILKLMGRKCSGAQMLELFEKIRERVPGAVIRSTAMVGFPGETDADFNELMEFARKVRFDHLGVFTYSDAEEIASSRLDDKVPADVAEQRRDELMGLQNEISLAHNEDRIGKSYEVLVEGESGDPEYPFAGRACFQAPDVDGVTFISGEGIQPGDFVNAKITGANAYDLWAEKI